MQFIEHINREMPDALSVKIDSPANTGLARCFRLLAGTVQVQRPGTRPILLGTFIPDPAFTGRARQRLQKLGSKLGDGLSVAELARLCKDNVRRNDKFFMALADELSWLLLYQSQKNHVASFVYLYRTLEAIAFSFPMIYATKSKDFRLSFDQIKKNFSAKENLGELGVFKQFVHAISEGTLQAIVYEIDISGLDANHTGKLKTTLERICKSLMKPEKQLMIVDGDTGILSIEFLAMPDFIVSFRNAFVHLQSGSPQNIGANELYDIEDFCEQIVREGLEFFCTVFLVVCEAMSD